MKRRRVLNTRFSAGARRGAGNQPAVRRAIIAPRTPLKLVFDDGCITPVTSALAQGP